MLKIKYHLIELKDLGFLGACYRILYEIFLGLRFFQVYDSLISFQKKWYRQEVTLAKWRAEKKAFFVSENHFKIRTFLQKLPQKNKQEIISIADRSLKGEILCFSHTFFDYGFPIDWHRNPGKNVSWPKNVHWSKALRFKGGGDVKLVWEANRFPQVFWLVRALHLTGDSKYINAFCDQTKSWVAENPFPCGVNWASGQEIAIRVLSWIFALYNFAGEKTFQDDDFRLILQSIQAQTAHIYRYIHYSYFAVHNNHLIGEALALYAVGTLFPFLKHAGKWKRLGRRILSGKALDQFYLDGGYCQLSHNYHRLALHYYLWALRVAEVNHEKFPVAVYQRIEKSGQFFLQNMNLPDGMLPNWGNNDGALFNPWTVCDYADFRPVVAAIYAITRNKRVFERGPWDEEVLWFAGKLPSEKQEIQLRSASFGITGIHILRKSLRDFLVFRCATPPDRFGQADQLHVDLFLNGENVLPDSGSFFYNKYPEYHSFFIGTRSHNSVTVDGQDQMLQWRKFKWLFKTRAKLLQWKPEQWRISGEHHGYCRLDPGVVHHRTIHWPDKQIIIRDDVTNHLGKQHTFCLHWQFNVIDLQIQENDKLFEGSFHTTNRTYYVYLFAEIEETLCEAEINKYRGFEKGQSVDGWISRYYAEKIPVFAVNLRVTKNQAVQFVTIISEKRLSRKEVLSCESC